MKDFSGFVTKSDAVDKYYRLTRIEDRFCVVKRDFETRLVYVHTPERAEILLLIGMIALVMKLYRSFICSACTSGNADIIGSSPEPWKVLET